MIRNFKSLQLISSQNNNEVLKVLLSVTQEGLGLKHLILSIGKASIKTLVAEANVDSTNVICQNY